MNRYTFLSPGHTYYVVWVDADGRDRYVPSGAPDRILALAAMAPGAKIVAEAAVPEGASSWHPDLDGPATGRR